MYIVLVAIISSIYMGVKFQHKRDKWIGIYQQTYSWRPQNGLAEISVAFDQCRLVLTSILIKWRKENRSYGGYHVKHCKSSFHLVNSQGDSLLDQLTFRFFSWQKRNLNTKRHINSPKNIKHAWTNGWSNGLGLPPSLPVDSILSAHLCN